MVLIRLQGCGVGCAFCDTKETWELKPGDRLDGIRSAYRERLDAIRGANPRWTWVDADDLARYVAERFPGPKWVLITGGEPAEQDLADLARALRMAGYQLALETSGTALGHVGAYFDWITVSPKGDMPGGKRLLPKAIYPADELKFVVGKESDLSEIDKFLAYYPFRGNVISLQPLSMSEKATELCIQTALKRGWNLSVQTHKFLRLP